MRVSKLQSFASGFMLLLAIFTLSAHGESYDNDSSAANIKIVSPADKSQVDAGEEYPLKYEVALNAGNDHFHVWVDDTRGPGIHDTKGTYTLPKMSPGAHCDHNQTCGQRSCSDWSSKIDHARCQVGISWKT